MIKKVLLLLLCCSFSSFGSAQNSVNDYSFVVVPELYDFLSEKDQFQLNSLTKFLFNKHGFNAYFDSELPNVKRCDGLYATVEGKPGFIYTKITVVLKDCYGTEVFRSQQGQSKYKEFRKAFHQSLRQAFLSVEALNANQKDVQTYGDLSEDSRDDSKYPVINDMKRIPKDEIETNTGVSVGTGTKLVAPRTHLKPPPDKFTNYTADGKSYLLRKTDSGYSFYEESEESETGLLLLGKITVTNDVAVYISEDGEVYTARFTDHSMVLSSGGVSKLYSMAD